MLRRIILSVCLAFPLLLRAQGTWTVYDTSNSGLPDNIVYTVASSNSGDVWAGTANGLAHFDGMNWTVYNTTNSGIPNNRINSIAVNFSDTVYIGTNSGLTIFDGTNWMTYTSSNSQIPGNQVKSLSFDRRGDLWGIAQNSIFKFSGTSWIVYNSSNSPFPSGSNLQDLTIDIFDNKWIGTTRGLMKFDNSSWAISGNISFTFAEVSTDVFGNAWSYTLLIGPLGIYVFDGTGWTTYNASNSGLPSDVVWAIAVDNSNIKWLGTTSGLARFDDSLWTVYDTSNSGIPNNIVTAIIIDASGNKWIATNSGLAKFTDGGAGPIGSDFTISGTFLTETGIPISGVTVTLSGDNTETTTTDSTGRYSFTVSQGNYTVTPSKNNDVVTNNGITSIDILLTRRQILGTPFSTPYKIIVADVDASNSVSTVDILLMRSMILQNIATFPNGRLWSFVPDDYVFADVLNPFPFPTSRTYTNITTNQTNQDFIGIKLGDVNGSWDAGVP